MKSQKLAVEGGSPVRTLPLPLEFPGVHYLDEREVEAVVRVLRARSPFRYYGVNLQREVEKLEAELARFYTVDYAIAVSSGTGALHAALSALGVGPGQEVIVPAYMWVSVLAAVVNHGAIPVIADIDDTFCLNSASVERCITPKTTGVIMVHMSGSPGDVMAVQKTARERNLWLLEDCAQCGGGSIGGKRVGSFGDMGIFSFQMNKNMTAGEGGAIVTNDYRLYRRAFACHDLGYARDQSGRLVFNDPDLRLWGMGYRMDELRAAVLRVQLDKLPRIIKAMHGSKYRIRRALEKLPGVQFRRIVDPQGDTGCFLITSYADAEAARRVNTALRAEGIVTYSQGISNVLMSEWGLHLYTNNVSLLSRSSVDARGFPWTLAENAGLGGRIEIGSCPVADDLFERSLLIPIPSSLTRQDEDDIVHAFQKVLRAQERLQV